MIIRPEQLARHLASTLQPLYWVSGDETLLVQESTDLIRKAAREQGFSERETWFVDNNFDWHTLQHSGNSLSLFAERKILELRLRASKFDDAAKAALVDYMADPGPDTLLLIVSPKLEPSTPKTKWFQKLEAAGAWIQIWPVDSSRLPAWLSQRLAARGLTADTDALQLLCDRVEGNLLAASQEIEKLAVLKQVGTGNAHLDVRDIAGSVADSSRYNVFQLIDHALAGDAARALRSLNSLRNEGGEALMIVAMLARELRSLSRMVQRRAAGERTAAILKSERIWQNRQAMVGAAVERLSSTQIRALLLRCRDIDLAVKGMFPAPPWILLEQALLDLAGIRSPYVPASQSIPA